MDALGMVLGVWPGAVIRVEQLGGGRGKFSALVCHPDAFMAGIVAAAPKLFTFCAEEEASGPISVCACCGVLLYHKQYVSCCLGTSVLGQWLNSPQDVLCVDPDLGKLAFSFWFGLYELLGRNVFTYFCLICFFWNSRVCERAVTLLNNSWALLFILALTLLWRNTHHSLFSWH